MPILDRDAVTGITSHGAQLQLFRTDGLLGLTCLLEQLNHLGPVPQMSRRAYVSGLDSIKATVDERGYLLRASLIVLISVPQNGSSLFFMTDRTELKP